MALARTAYVSWRKILFYAKTGASPNEIVVSPMGGHAKEAAAVGRPAIRRG